MWFNNFGTVIVTQAQIDADHWLDAHRDASGKYVGPVNALGHPMNASGQDLYYYLATFEQVNYAPMPRTGTDLNTLLGQVTAGGGHPITSQLDQEECFVYPCNRTGAINAPPTSLPPLSPNPIGVIPVLAPTAQAIPTWVMLVGAAALYVFFTQKGSAT